MKRNCQNPLAEQEYSFLLSHLDRFPVHFTYSGKEYSGFGGLNHLSSNTQEQNGVLTTENLFRLDALTVTLITSFYKSHGAYEWTVYFENTTNENSGVLENVYSQFEFKGEAPCLKGIYGDLVNRYKPYQFDLAKQDVHFKSDSGRATHENFPYFNLEYGSGGAMLAIGWAGTWSADFEKTDGGVLYTARSVNNLKTYLKAGEKIRTALFAVAPYHTRNEHYATNYWRDWFIQYNMPKADGEGNDLTPFSCCCLASDTGLTNSDGSISEQYNTWRPTLEKMIAEDVKVNFRWFDAGWYQTPYLGSAEPYVKGRDWWDTVGTWTLDPVKWPGDSFLQSTEFARQNGMKTLMWFEPERVTYPDDLAKNFGYKREWAIECDDSVAISNNIGDDECRKWTTERICKTLRDNKVEMYREDNNCSAAALWAHLDSLEGEKRIGITECKFIYGHYKMWDDIIACTKSYGGCAFVDSCAAGGGRNDLESMRRGVPLLRSDADRTTANLRLSMTSSFNKWIPFCGANTKEKKTDLALTGDSDTFIWRASYLPSLNVDSQFVYDSSQDFDVLRFGLNEWKKAAPYLLKEFYVLTPWHSGQDDTGFTAFCFFDPETEKGCLLAFRQSGCEQTSLNITLPFAADKCTVTDEDSGKTFETGADFTLEFDQPRSSKLLWVILL